MHIRTGGLASVYAYRSYKDPDFLQIAQNVWNDAHEWEITSEDVSDWSSTGSFQSNCNGCKYPALGK